ncbi:carbohydrate esterase family 3 protein [Amniculicola lignicola CBS 123094]|uniref:Carbohydrate esterase family 3 protein n=1 Tax=Amniculicola lignicola CBS 123094 TaxID=1392246 RepID=A0A6A5WKY0_9PLEO|nr:carbohydrate esterase family 3 protein [Amniculicola lignicola CBS 123094]
MVKLFSTILAVATLSQAVSAATVKVMPLGASIVTYCWRANLWKKLMDSNINGQAIDFVGSQSGGDCGFTFDNNHEGHSGALAIEYVEKNFLPPWLATAKPDVIVMHLGTNDVVQNKNTTDVIKAYSTLVDQMRASKPTMKIVFAQILPIAPSLFGQATSNRVVALNKAIAAWVSTKTTARSKIYLVDQFTGFNATTDTVEGEHPNAAGNVKIADKFYPAVVSAIADVSAPETALQSFLFST